MKRMLANLLITCMVLALIPLGAMAKTELVVSMSSSYEEQAWFQSAIVAFQESHPDVELVLEPHEGTSARPKVMSQIYSGNAPDVLLANLYWVKDFAQNGWIYPLNEYFDQATIDDFFTDFNDYVTVDGKLYGFFNGTDVATIIYRKSMLEAAGIDIPAENECWTWDEFVQAGQKLTQDTNGDGRTDVWGIGVSAANEGTTTYTHFPMYCMLGGELVASDGSPAIGGEATVKAFQFYYDLLNTYKTTPSESYAYSYNEMLASFNAGQYAMIFGASWMIGNLEPQFPDDVFAMLYPVPEKDVASEGLCGGWVYTLMSEDEETRSLGAEFIAEMISVENGVTRYEQTQTLPVRQSVFDQVIAKEQNATRKSWLNVFNEQMKHTNLKPGDAIYDIIQDEYTTHLEQAMSGAMTPEAAAQEAYNNCVTRGREAGFLP